MHQHRSRLPLKPEVFEEDSETTEADGLTRAQVEAAMIRETAEEIRDIPDEDAAEIVREHLPPWLRDRFSELVA